MPVTFRTSAGRAPAALIRDIEAATQPKREHFMYVLERQKTRILERTARGVDANGRAFDPYSPNGPVYFYPLGKAGGKKLFSATQRKRAAERFARSVGTGRGSVTAGGGVRFENYAAMKRALGRGGAVDLRGVSAPHMLQGIVAKVDGPQGARLGIYGEPAERGTYHNTGTRNMPQRLWFAWGRGDAAEAGKNLLAAMRPGLHKI